MVSPILPGAAPRSAVFSMFQVQHSFFMMCKLIANTSAVGWCIGTTVLALLMPFLGVTSISWCMALFCWICQEDHRSSSHIIVCIVGWPEGGRVVATVVHICPFAIIFDLEVVVSVTQVFIIASFVFLWLDHVLFHACGCFSCSPPFSDVYLPPSIVTLQSFFAQPCSITLLVSCIISHLSCICLALVWLFDRSVYRKSLLKLL